MSAIRAAYRRRRLAALARQTRCPDSADLRRPAVVFSPHFDDETLGAGGTIARKRAAGAPVHLVFMTDGSRSHAAMEGSRLAGIRKAESIRAAAALGVPEDHVEFLDLPETRLTQHRGLALDRVAQVLSRVSFEEVYVPSTLEPILWSADHCVTTEVVFNALAAVAKSPDVCEYLIWYWYHWPWVPIERGAGVVQLIRLSVQSRFGLPAWTGLNVGVPVADVLDRKWAALEQYESQMTRLVPGQPWPVLADVGRGEFMKCFFGPTEYFKRYTFEPAS